MLLEGIAPLSHTTVGVAMPISITFTDPVKVKARKRVEQHIKLTTSVPVSGAWHWFGYQRVDFRPKTFWKPGTKVSMVASLQPRRRRLRSLRHPQLLPALQGRVPTFAPTSTWSSTRPR